MASIKHCKLFKNVWPNETDAIPMLIQNMIHELKPNELMDGLIERSSAKEPMFSEFPLAKDVWINNFFKNHLGPCKVFIVAEI